MVISGTHALDICMWCLEGKTPVEVYARSVDKVLGPLHQGIDATAGMIMMSDGSVYHLNMKVGAAGDLARCRVQPGVRHRRHRGRAHHRRHPSRHRAGGFGAAGRGLPARQEPFVDFMGSYPPGDMALGELRGPMREETDSWPNRVSLGSRHPGRHRRRGAQPPDAQQGPRPLRQAPPAREAAAEVEEGRAAASETMLKKARTLAATMLETAEADIDGGGAVGQF